MAVLQAITSPGGSQPLSPASNAGSESRDPLSTATPATLQRMAKPEHDPRSVSSPLSPDGSSGRDSGAGETPQGSDPVAVPQQTGHIVGDASARGNFSVGSPEHMMMRSISTVPRPGTVPL